MFERRTRLVLGGALLAIVAGAAVLVSPAAALRALSWVAADPARFAVVCVAFAVVRPVFAWPTTLLAVAVGYGYGLVGIPFALVLITLTSVPPYLLGRRAGREGRVAAAGRRVADATGDLRGVTASRLVPAPSDVVSVGAGVAGVSLGPFLVGTAVGEIPWAVAGVVAGASLDTLTAGSLSGVFDPRLVAGAAAAAAVLLAGPLYRLWSERRTLLQ